MALLDEEENRASFGFFPQMQPRRRLQDVQGSANLPVDVTRGRLAGLLGLIPDVLNFMGRSPMPTETFGETQYNPRPQLPYDTDFYLKNLPLAPTSRAGQVAGQAASFVPLNPAPLVRAGVAGAQALAPTAARMTEGFMQRQGFMPGVMPAQPSGLLTPEIPAPKPQAPVSDLGFYSAAEQAAMNLQRGKGTGQSFLNDLMKAPDVKKDELQYTGLDEFLKDKPNVTRQEVTDYLSKNKVDLQEVRLGETVDPAEVRAFMDDEAGAGFTYDEAVDYLRNSDSAPRYEKYQLPGGENYREILLKLPQQWDKPRAAQIANEERIKALRQEMYGTSGTNEIRSEISRLQNENTALQKQISEAPIYKSSHFNEPNILAHMRVNDRVDADGKKMLLVEEIQSDWHQAGREQGYNTPQAKAQMQKKLDDLDEERKNLRDEQAKLEEMAMPFTSQNKDAPSEILDRWNIVSNRLNNLQREYAPIANQISTGSIGVPDAPFKDNWYQLSLKRLVKYAADNGYERIGLTTGKQQAERYDLSKQIKTIIYSQPDANGLRRVEAITPSGDRLLGKKYTENQISENVGKEIAEKIINKTGDFDKRTNTYSMSDLDLSVGGEGMKKYYDEIYPKYLEKYGKKFDAKVGETKVNTVMERADNSMIPKMGQEPVRYIDITPKMKESVSKGQPLFTAAPIGGIGTGLLSDEQRKELSGLLGP